MHYSQEFKERALELVQSIGVVKAAQQLNINRKTLGRWRKEILDIDDEDNQLTEESNEITGEKTDNESADYESDNGSVRENIVKEDPVETEMYVPSGTVFPDMGYELKADQEVKKIETEQEILESIEVKGPTLEELGIIPESEDLGVESRMEGGMYTPEFHRKVMEKVKEIGVVKTARMFGINRKTISRWEKADRENAAKNKADGDKSAVNVPVESDTVSDGTESSPEIPAAQPVLPAEEQENQLAENEENSPESNDKQDIEKNLTDGSQQDSSEDAPENDSEEKAVKDEAVSVEETQADAESTDSEEDEDHSGTDEIADGVPNENDLTAPDSQKASDTAADFETEKTIIKENEPQTGETDDSREKDNKSPQNMTLMSTELREEDNTPLIPETTDMVSQTAPADNSELRQKKEEADSGNKTADEIPVMNTTDEAAEPLSSDETGTVTPGENPQTEEPGETVADAEDDESIHRDDLVTTGKLEDTAEQPQADTTEPGSATEDPSMVSSDIPDENGGSESSLSEIPAENDSGTENTLGEGITRSESAEDREDADSEAGIEETSFPMNENPPIASDEIAAAEDSVSSETDISSDVSAAKEIEKNTPIEDQTSTEDPGAIEETGNLEKSTDDKGTEQAQVSENGSVTASDEQPMEPVTRENPAADAPVLDVLNTAAEQSEQKRDSEPNLDDDDFSLPDGIEGLFEDDEDESQHSEPEAKGNTPKIDPPAAEQGNGSFQVKTDEIIKGTPTEDTASGKVPLTDYQSDRSKYHPGNWNQDADVSRYEGNSTRSTRTVFPFQQTQGGYHSSRGGYQRYGQGTGRNGTSYPNSGYRKNNDSRNVRSNSIGYQVSAYWNSRTELPPKPVTQGSISAPVPENTLNDRQTAAVSQSVIREETAQVRAADNEVIAVPKISMENVKKETPAAFNGPAIPVPDETLHGNNPGSFRKSAKETAETENPEDKGSPVPRDSKIETQPNVTREPAKETGLSSTKEVVSEAIPEVMREIREETSADRRFSGSLQTKDTGNIDSEKETSDSEMPVQKPDAVQEQESLNESNGLQDENGLHDDDFAFSGTTESASFGQSVWQPSNIHPQRQNTRSQNFPRNQGSNGKMPQNRKNPYNRNPQPETFGKRDVQGNGITRYGKEEAKEPAETAMKNLPGSFASIPDNVTEQRSQTASENPVKAAEPVKTTAQSSNAGIAEEPKIPEPMSHSGTAPEMKPGLGQQIYPPYNPYMYPYNPYPNGLNGMTHDGRTTPDQMPMEKHDDGDIEHVHTVPMSTGMPLGGWMPPVMGNMQMNSQIMFQPIPMADPYRVEILKKLDELSKENLALREKFEKLNAEKEAAKAASRRLAILIDAENISYRYAEVALQTAAKYGRVIYKRIYADWSQFGNCSWKSAILNFSLHPIQQFNNVRKKNSSDSALIIDAMELLYSGKVDGFVIVSSDSDFTGLAVRMREANMLVVGMGELKTPPSFKSACDHFEFLDVLGKQDSEHDENIPMPKVMPKPSPRPRTFRNTSTAGSRHSQPVVRPLLSKEELCVIIDGIIDECGDNDGWMDMAPLGYALKQNVKDFDVRNYGYAKLKPFMESLGQYQFRTESNGPSGNGLPVWVRKMVNS